MAKHTFTHRIPVVITTRSTLVNGTKTVWSGEATVFGNRIASVWEADGCTEEAEVLDFLRESVDEMAETFGS